MSKPCSFPFYPNNWLASERVMMMAPEQEGAYIRLLALQWNSESQTIPDDDAILSKLSRLDGRWPTLGEAVKECFDSVKDMPGRIRNERLYACWNERKAFIESKVRGGKNSAAVRWGGVECPVEEEPEETPTPLPGFDSFWTAWPAHPRKADRKECLKVWKAGKLEKDSEKILQAVTRFKASEDWKKDQGQYIPAPIVWLRQSRWEGAEHLTKTGTYIPVKPATPAGPKEWKDMTSEEREKALIKKNDDRNKQVRREMEEEVLANPWLCPRKEVAELRKKWQERAAAGSSYAKNFMEKVAKEQTANPHENPDGWDTPPKREKRPDELEPEKKKPFGYIDPESV